MIIRDIPQIRVVRGNTPEAFEESFNRIMCNMAEDGIKVKVDFDLPNLTAFIHYSDEMRIISNRADYAQATGCAKTCGECPHLQKPRSLDGRRKNFYCELDGGTRLHRMTEAACEQFYIEREKGESNGHRY